jgi:hypothetical protein
MQGRLSKMRLGIVKFRLGRYFWSTLWGILRSSILWYSNHKNISLVWLRPCSVTNIQNKYENLMQHANFADQVQNPNSITISGITIDMPQAPHPRVNQSRPKVSNTYWSSYRKADDSSHNTNPTTLCIHTKSPFYRIKPSKCPVFLVCPACYRPSPVSCVNSYLWSCLRLFPIPWPCLLLFHCKSLFHIVCYTMSHCLPIISLLICCLIVISRALMSIIPIILTPSHSIKDVPSLFINNKKFTPTHIISYKPSP